MIEKSLDVSGNGPEGNIGLQGIEINSEGVLENSCGFLLDLAKRLVEHALAIEASLPGYRPFSRP